MWIFMGDSRMDSFNRRLDNEEEDRSALRGAALRRLAMLVGDDIRHGRLDAEEARRMWRMRINEVRELRFVPEVPVLRRRVHQGENAGYVQGHQVPQVVQLQPMQDQPQPQPQIQRQHPPARGSGPRPRRKRGDGRPAPFPAMEFPWSRGLGGRGRGRTRRQTKSDNRDKVKALGRRDPWLGMLELRARHPELFEWLHRVRATQHLLMAAHPSREHIRRVLESEEVRAADLARALLQGQEATGAATYLDISWPPPNSRTGTNTIIMGRPGLFVPGAELSDESDDEENMGYTPPPACKYWRGQGRGHRGGRGGRGGRGRRGGGMGLAH